MITPRELKDKKIALVSGANKGLGYEIARQLAAKGVHVLLTSRNAELGKKAAGVLKGQGLDVVFCPMDVDDAGSVRKAFEFVKKTYGRLDILVNNAGVMLEEDRKTPGLQIDAETVRKTFETNTLGHLVVSQTFIPLMVQNRYGRIVNVSSGMGALSDMDGGYLAYRVSKAALNAVTRVLASELKGTNVLVNTMCPGWCRTDMGGREATRSVEEGARTAVYLATLPDGSPSGRFFRDEREIAW
jgi:NAD(P)-dependent dehydrogenase (short-subunit alcohol dehydrogenase family)